MCLRSNEQETKKFYDENIFSIHWSKCTDRNLHQCFRETRKNFLTQHSSYKNEVKLIKPGGDKQGECMVHLPITACEDDKMAKV